MSLYSGKSSCGVFHLEPANVNSHRDPWWVLTTIYLVVVIHRSYAIPMTVLFKRAPRFGIMLVSMAASIIFITVDVISNIVPKLSSTVGINPYWKFALIFKCFCDTIILDDFKTALEKLRRGVMETLETVRFDDGEDAGLDRQRRNAIDRTGHSGHRFLDRVRTMSIPISPTTTTRDQSQRKAWKHRMSLSQDPEASHVEHAEMSNDSYRSSRFTLDDELVKEEVDVEAQARHNRADYARERIGKVGMRLAKLPSLAGFRSHPSKRSDVDLENNKRTELDDYTRSASYDFAQPEKSQRSLRRPSTRTSSRSSASQLVRSNRKSIPDPYHIPSDNELESDPTGRRTFEERRRIKTSRDDSTPTTTTNVSSNNLPHPGVPWGTFEGEEFDEPWGVNVSAVTKRRISEQAEARDRQKSRSPSSQNSKREVTGDTTGAGSAKQDSDSEKRVSESSEEHSIPEIRISFRDTL